MIFLAIIIPFLIGMVVWNEKNRRFDERAEILTNKLNHYLKEKKCH